MPRLQRLADRLKGKGLQVLTIDVYDDDLAASRQLLKKLQVNLPMVMDGKGATSLRYRYGITAVPCNSLIGADGKVLARLEGWNEVEVLKILQASGISAQ